MMTVANIIKFYCAKHLQLRSRKNLHTQPEILFSNSSQEQYTLCQTKQHLDTKELKIVTGKEGKGFALEYSKQYELPYFLHHVLLLHVLQKGNTSLDTIWQHKASSWTSQWDPTQTL